MSLSYSYTHIDSRDSPSNPTKGDYLLSKLELAIPPGSTQSLKLETTAEKHLTFDSILGLKISPTVLSLGSTLGTIQPIIYQSKLNKDINLSDRYFNGGGLGLRGYQLAGIGTKSTQSPNNNLSFDSLGGIYKLNMIALLSGSLPFKFPTSDSLKSFLFANAGTLINSTNNNQSIHENILSNMRLSVGCGLSYSLGPVRLEACYAIPIRYSKHDSVKPFQLSIGLGIIN